MARKKTLVRAPKRGSPTTDRIKGETVTPTATWALMDAVGPSRASRLLGVSTTTLHKTRKHGLVSKVIEVAAHGALRDIGGDTAPSSVMPATLRHSPTMTAILEYEAGKGAMVDQFAQMIGARVLKP